MIVTILGSGTLVPNPNRGPAGFLVQVGATRLLVDGGTGTLQRLAQVGADCRELDGGLYTHRHIDHCADLVPLLFAMRVGIDHFRTRPYPLWAGTGFTSYLDQLRSIYGDWITTPRFDVPVHELSLDGPDAADLPGGLRLETRPANHQEGALHLRVTGPAGERVVFSGDTGPSEALVELASGADLLICECALTEASDYPFHLKPSHVVDLVARTRPGRVVLTHFYPDTDPDAAVALVRSLGVPTSRGADGLAVGLGPDAT